MMNVFILFQYAACVCQYRRFFRVYVQHRSKKSPSDIQRSYFIRELESAAEDRIEITR